MSYSSGWKKEREREREKAERLCDAMPVCKRARRRRRRGKKRGRMIFLRCYERKKSSHRERG